ncbi:uncharacterized protein LOC108232264 [Kryptolebias marmoratus]|uniref:uncharacterized protein LOC108232264 n=1 Tax=Kryptolebias marmoratus TaxID=37003 RepID=UPI000D530209|nr:uncharacterized protein LOC108232264 [Kryptolebias marmoratus]
MEKKSHPELALIILLMAVFWLEAEVEILVYSPNEELGWDDARKYCRENYIDLVTGNIEAIDLADLGGGEYYAPMWIGLREDPDQSSVWKWINIKTGEGLTGEDVSKNLTWTKFEYFGHCGSYNEIYYQTLCSTKLYFLCFDDNLVLVTENKTWEDALSHCRNMTTSSYQYDLLSFTDSSDFSYVRDRIYRATTEEVWTGLRFLGGEWWWSDGETLDPQEMLPDCPSRWKHCGTVSKNNTDNWITRDCSEKRNFICTRQDVFLTNDLEDNV